MEKIGIYSITGYGYSVHLITFISILLLLIVALIFIKKSLDYFFNKNLEKHMKEYRKYHSFVKENNLDKFESLKVGKFELYKKYRNHNNIYIIKKLGL